MIEINSLGAAPQGVSTRTDGSIRPSPLLDVEGLMYCSGGIIDHSLCYDPGAPATGWVRAGTIWGRVTATGKLVPCRNTQLTATASSGQANITVRSAYGFMEGDTISVAGVSHTIDSINYSTNVITLTANLAANKAVGDAVIGRGTLLAGSEIAIGISVKDVFLWDTFQDAAADVRSIEHIASIGRFDSDYVLGDATAASAYSGNHMTHCYLSGQH